MPGQPDTRPAGSRGSSPPNGPSCLRRGHAVRNTAIGCCRTSGAGRRRSPPPIRPCRPLRERTQSPRAILEPRLRQRQVSVEHEPPFRAVVVGDLDAVPGAGRSWFGRADVAVVHQLRSEPQHPERDRRLQMRHGHGAEADLGAVRTNQRSDRIDGIALRFQEQVLAREP